MTSITFSLLLIGLSILWFAQTSYLVVLIHLRTDVALKRIDFLWPRSCESKDNGQWKGGAHKQARRHFRYIIRVLVKSATWDFMTDQYINCENTLLSSRYCQSINSARIEVLWSSCNETVTVTHYETSYTENMLVPVISTKSEGFLFTVGTNITFTL